MHVQMQERPHRGLLCAVLSLAIAPEVLRFLRLLWGHLGLVCVRHHSYHGRRWTRCGDLVSTSRIGLLLFLRNARPCSMSAKDRAPAAGQVMIRWRSESSPQSE